MRMPRYYVSNDGMGPYAIFYCDRCDREYRSQPSIAATVKEDVTRGALGGFLRNIPVVGNSMANNMENDRYRSSMTPQELESAWGEVQQYFRECPTCHEIVCIPDFDEVSGFCDEDSPRRGQIEQAKAEQAAGFMTGIANAFGIGDAIRQASVVATANLATCSQCGNKAAAGTKFCPNCGGPMTQPAPPTTNTVSAPSVVKCGNCGATVPDGQKFCGECGTPVPVAQAPQQMVCPNCGTETTSAFCGSCGTKVR